MLIYVIKNKLNGKVYVGQTTNSLYQRWAEHKYSSKQLKCRAIHGAIQKYGIENFSIETLEELSHDCGIETLNEREIFWIKELNSTTPNGYNIRIGGLSGGKHSEESKKKMSLSAIGKHSGKIGPMSDSHKENLSKAHIGKTPWNKGIPHSAETRLKMSKIHKGIKLTENHKKKIGNALKGRVFSKEHRKKLDKARYGRKLSQETREKIRQSLKKRRERQ